MTEPAPDLFNQTRSQRAYRGLSPEQRSLERKQRLLAAALELFAGQGYANTTIEQLCATSKVTARHFYALFANREALLTELYNTIVDDLRDAVAEAISAPELALSAKLELAVQALISQYLRDARRARIGVLESVGVSTAMEQRRRAAIHDIARVIESFLDALVMQGELPTHDYHLVSIAIVGGINELLADWLTRAVPPGIEHLGQEVTRILNALIRGSAERPSQAPENLNRTTAPERRKP